MFQLLLECWVVLRREVTLIWWKRKRWSFISCLLSPSISISLNSSSSALFVIPEWVESDECKSEWLLESKEFCELLCEERANLFDFCEGGLVRIRGSFVSSTFCFCVLCANQSKMRCCSFRKSVLLVSASNEVSVL